MSIAELFEDVPKAAKADVFGDDEALVFRGEGKLPWSIGKVTP